MKLSQKKQKFTNILLLLSLLAAGFGVALFDPLVYLFPNQEHFLTNTYFAFPCLLFFCTLFMQPLSGPAKRALALSFITILWFAAVQRQYLRLDMGTYPISLFAIAYLIAFPFAAVTDKSVRKASMKWLGILYIAASGLLILFTVLLLLDLVPEVLIPRIYWDGARLHASWHPNIGSNIMMTAIGFVLYFLTQENTRQKKILLALLAAVQFCVLSLTHSRAATLLACALMGGTVFFIIWKGGWKRFLAGAAAAVVVIAATYLFSDSLFSFHASVRNVPVAVQPPAESPQPVPQETIIPEEFTTPAPAETTLPVPVETTLPAVEETTLPVPEETLQPLPEETLPLVSAEDAGNHTVNNPQGTLLNDIWTLNNRSLIWKAAFTAMRDNPDLRIWGTKNVGTEISYRFGLPIAHAHNSWIQTRMELGIPGLLLALLYTGIALIRCAWILLCRKADPGKKVIALLVLCIMAAGFLEPFLFVGDISTMFANFLFFFLTGFLGHWCRELYGRKPANR